LQRITHLGIGAHQDDLEFMAFHGVVACYHSDAQWFGGVTCTNGGGSARTGPYANCTDTQMMAIRRREQNAAAAVGRYGVMIQLDYPSSAVKSAAIPRYHRISGRFWRRRVRRSSTPTIRPTNTTRIWRGDQCAAGNAGVAP
jgi:LmbE family N-acetylglucosaminyl deacetylase